MNSLPQHLLFADLNEDQLRRVTASASTLQLAEGEHLFRQQQPAHYFFLLKTGEIKLYRLSPSGEEKVIELIREGQTFAEAVMFMQGGAYPVNAQALVNCQLVQIEMDAFRSLLEQSPQTCLKILGHMSQRLHGVIQEIDQLTLQNAKMRVVRFLLKELPINAVAPTLLQWTTPKAVLASRLSVRPETFSRILQQLIQEETIQVEGKNVMVLDIDALRQA